MQFKDVIGQIAIKQTLAQMVQQNRMPHAQLFLGSSGYGSLALAIAFAQYILCTNKQTDDACGTCRSCMKAQKFIHPDIHFSFPTIGSKVTSDSFLPQWRTALSETAYLDYNEWLQNIGAENKQGNINKDECVNIIKKMSLKTFEGSHKILIMWLPEYLGKEGNRLLKLIEEPPENTIFILVAENQELILNTILSRCQLVNIHALSDEDIKQGLVQTAGISESEADAIVYMSDGNFREALKLTKHKETENSSLFLDWMRKCYLGKPLDMVTWVEEFATIGREKQKFFIRYALHFMREYMILKMTNNNRVRLQHVELSSAQNLTKIIAFDQIEAITNILSDAAYYVERNANPKVLFLDTSIQMHRILKPAKR